MDEIGKIRHAHFRDGRTSKEDQPGSGYIGMSDFIHAHSGNFSYVCNVAINFLYYAKRQKMVSRCPNYNLLRKQRFGKVRRKYRMPRVKRWAAPSSISSLAGD